MRILHVEDEALVTDVVALLLGNAGFYVYSTPFGEEGIDLLKVYDYDLCLLDSTLPDMTGFEFLTRVRQRENITTPVLMLTGMYGHENVARALGLGADEYMTKPFHNEELIARIHAVTRRAKGHAENRVETGDLILNLDNKTVTVAGAHVNLTGREYQMLELLSLRKGAPLSKEQFLNHMYGGLDEPCTKIIDVFICKLRKKLANASGGKDYIETVWGRGYVLRSQPSALTASANPTRRQTADAIARQSL